MAANQVDGIFTSHCLKLALWRLPDGPDVIDLIEFVIVRCNYSPLYSPPPSVRYECGVNTSVSGQKCFDKSENIAGIRPASESSGGSAAWGRAGIVRQVHLVDESKEEISMPVFVPGRRMVSLNFAWICIRKAPPLTRVVKSEERNGFVNVLFNYTHCDFVWYQGWVGVFFSISLRRFPSLES